MKISKYRSVCTAALAGCALLVMSSVSPRLVAKEMVPYKAAGYGVPLELNVEWPSDENPQGRVWGVLLETGQATQFGKYQSRGDIEGYFEWEGEVLVLIWTGTYVQEAADGSSITGQVVGREPLIPAPTPFTMTITVTSGTGRFKGATGSWEMFALSTGDYTYTAEGMISSIGSVRGAK